MRNSPGPDDAPDTALDQHVRPRHVALLRAATDRAAQLGLERPRRRTNFTSTLQNRGLGDSETRAGLERAKERLDRLDWYPRPVRIEQVRVLTSRHVFKLPWIRRFDGFAAWSLILLRESPVSTGDDLLTHELCHVWQMQHRPIEMPLSYLRHGYVRNPYEAEARRAADETRS